MKISPNLINFVKEFEGFREKAELDTLANPPVFTIGYGETKNVHQGDNITEQEASEKLASRLQEFGDEMIKYVSVSLTQGQFDALTDFCYNVGIGNFKKSTLLKLLNQNKLQETAKQFDKWVYSGGVKREGLIKRRNQEKQWFIGS